MKIFDLEGKTAVVTGGAKGIGAATVKVLKEAGAASRAKAVNDMATGLGGSLESFHFAFGDVDAYVVVDLPDDEAAAAARQAEAQEVVTRTLDEARDSTRKVMDEARRDISARTASFNEYQEQTINAARDIAENYLDSQKEVVNSMQSSWVPYIENVYSMYWTGWMSPRRMTEIYARMARNFSDNAIAATRVANNMMFANMEAAKASIQYTRDNMKELSRIGVNAVFMAAFDIPVTATIRVRFESRSAKASMSSRPSAVSGANRTAAPTCLACAPGSGSRPVTAAIW